MAGGVVASATLVGYTRGLDQGNRPRPSGKTTRSMRDAWCRRITPRATAPPRVRIMRTDRKTPASILALVVGFVRADDGAGLFQQGQMRRCTVRAPTDEA